MIKTFAHKGLKRFFEKGDKSGINPHHEKKIRFQLDRLFACTKANDMDIENLGFKKLKGCKHTYQTDINGPWRLRFVFRSGNAYDVDYGQWH